MTRTQTEAGGTATLAQIVFNVTTELLIYSIKYSGRSEGMTIKIKIIVNKYKLNKNPSNNTNKTDKNVYNQ